MPLEQQWRPLLIISGIHDMPKDADGETVQNHLTWETSNPCQHRELARGGPRERPDHPRGHQRRDVGATQLLLSLDSKQPGAGRFINDDRSDFYNQIKRINQLIMGISEGTMSHGEAWDFFQLGKYLERACQTARILDVKYHILLADRRAHRYAGRQRALGGDPDELLGIRAVSQAAAAVPTRASRLPTS